MKKIFALVLSLCMVLSTFVAVSAQEQVWNEGVYVEGNEVTLVNISKNFDATDAEVLYGAGIAGSQVADPAGERTGMVAGGAISTGSTGYIGVKLPVSGISTGDVVEISLDVYSSADWQAGAGTTQGVMLRAGNSWAPAGDWEQVLKKETVSANTWTTLTNTFTFTKDVSGTGIWMQIRPNVVLDYFYVDNLSLTVKGPRTVVAAASTDCDADDGVIEKGGSAAINGTETADGRTYLKTHVGSGATDLVGFRLKDADGNLYAIPEAGDTLIFSMDINPSASFTPNTGTQGFLLRQGDSIAFPGTGEQYKQLAPTTAIPANQWTTVTGSFEFTDAWKVSRGNPNPQLCLGIRTNAEMDIKIDNVSYKVVRAAEKVEAGWEVEPGWGTPDNSIPSTIKLMNVPGTASGNNFSFAMSGVAEYFSTQTEANNPYTASIAIIPDTPVAKDSSWKIEADLVMNGLVDTTGATNVWVRCVDNTSSATQGKTVGYVQKGVTVEDGTIHLEFSSDDMIAGGGTSTSSTIAMFGISFDSSQICNYTDLTANTGSYAYNNVTIVSEGLKLDYAKDGANLKITNNNAEKYKFTGRVFFAEYDGNELIQFYAAGNIEEEIEAGSSVTVENTGFENAVSKNLKIFVWETDSMIPAMDVIE